MRLRCILVFGTLACVAQQKLERFVQSEKLLARCTLGSCSAQVLHLY